MGNIVCNNEGYQREFAIFFFPLVTLRLALVATNAVHEGKWERYNEARGRVLCSLHSLNECFNTRTV